MDKQEKFFPFSKFDNFSDEEVVAFVKKGDTDALEYLLNKYKNIVCNIVNRFFVIGSEKDDIEQEGMIGLYKAIKYFDETKQKSFKNFVNMCVNRYLFSVVKSNNTGKNIALNTYVSLNNNAYSESDNDSQLIDILDANADNDPLDIVTKKEYYATIGKNINDNLSNFEKQVLQNFMDGYSYNKIAENLNVAPKSIDNAIQRIRKKGLSNIS
jgi:RNA polymerase sporulation-specific sigma factor